MSRSRVLSYSRRVFLFAAGKNTYDVQYSNCRDESSSEFNGGLLCASCPRSCDQGRGFLHHDINNWTIMLLLPSNGLTSLSPW